MQIFDISLGDTIKIGDSTATTVLDVRGGQVRIGIKANLNTPIHREEIYHRIHGENANCKFAIGMILNISDEKGFCFVRSRFNQSSNDVFIHLSQFAPDCLNILKADSMVKFQITKSAKGYRGINASVIDNLSQSG